MARFEINSENIPPDLEPDENIILWRYMSFASLCEIQMNNHIPLISVQNFSDKSEGIILKEILSKLPNINKNSLEFVMEIYRKSIHVSSWHISENENAAMWDRYTYGGEGVAIKTNAKLLLNSIPEFEIKPMLATHRINNETGQVEQVEPTTKVYCPPAIIIKPIQYTNNKPSDFEIKEELLQRGYAGLSFFYKMKDFEDESEMRILRSAAKNAYTYIYEDDTQIEKLNEIHTKFPFLNSIPLRLIPNNKFIQQIVVSPYAHNQFIETVQQTISDINFKHINVHRDPRDSIQPLIINPNIVIESRRKKWV